MERRRRARGLTSGWFPGVGVAALLIAALLLSTLLGGLAPRPAGAQVPPAAAGGDGGAAEQRPWLDVNKARRCGRLWCSAVVFPQDLRQRREITLAIRPEEGMGAAAAARAVEERAETVQASVQGVIDTLRRSLRHGDLPIPSRAEAPVGMPFWPPWQERGRHPLTPTVALGIQNRVPVLIAAADRHLGLAQVTLLTITEPDLLQAGSSESELVERWTPLLQEAISRGLWGLEFDQRYPLGRLGLALAVTGAAALLWALITALRSVLRRPLHRLRRRGQRLQDTAAQQAMAAFSGSLPPTEAPPPAEEPPLPIHPGLDPSRRSSPQWLQRINITARSQQRRLLDGTSRLLEPLSIRGLRRQGWRVQLQNLLEMALVLSNLLRVSLVVGGVGAIAALVPESRIAALVMMKQSVAIPLIWVGVSLARLVAVLCIDHSVNNWTIESTLTNPGSNRYALRAVSYSKVLKNVADVVSVGLGIAGTLVVIGIDQAVLTGAGVLAIAISLLLRNLLDDVMQGVLILLSDRYAIGDVVVIPPHDGFVENMSLFQTQLRGIDGQLTSLPNGSIRAVENLTKDWSRVNFEIEVSAAENLREVLALIAEVAEAMGQDPAWSESFLDTPEVLGVDRVTQAGCLIRVWIKTQPLAQWLVGREFRVRIKEAFDRQGIQLGMPRQEVLLDPLPRHG